MFDDISPQTMADEDDRPTDVPAYIVYAIHQLFTTYLEPNLWRVDMPSGVVIVHHDARPQDDGRQHVEILQSVHLLGTLFVCPRPVHIGTKAVDGNNAVLG